MPIRGSSDGPRPLVEAASQLVRLNRIKDGVVLLGDLSQGYKLSWPHLENWITRAEQKAPIRGIREGGPEQ